MTSEGTSYGPGIPRTADLREGDVDPRTFRDMHLPHEWHRPSVTPDFEVVTKASLPTSALDTQVGGAHYKDFPIQPVEFIEGNDLTFLEGCVIKRLCRHSRGGKGVQDIDKAIHELQLLKEQHYPDA